MKQTVTLRPDRRVAVACVLALTTWWGLLFALGFPRPHYDDLFFAGPAINLAHGGDLANPWIRTWMQPFGTESFFVQPPFHPWLLAGWLRMFGVGDHALRLFGVIGAWATGLGLLVLGRRAGLAWPLVLTLSIVVSSWLVDQGLRPDGTGLLFCTFALIGWTGRGPVAWTAGSICGAAAPLVHPYAATLIVPLAVWGLLKADQTEAARSQWRHRSAPAALMALAVGVVFLLFLVSIGGELREFIRVFDQHAVRRMSYTGSRLAVITGLMTIGWEPLVRWPSLIVLAAALGLGWHNPIGAHRARVVGLLYAGMAGLGAALYPTSLIRMMYVGALVAAALLLPVLTGRRRQILFNSWVFACLLMLGPSAIQTGLTRPATIDAPAWRDRLAPLLAEPGRRVLLDEYVARYVFNWRLPVGAEDWLHGHRAGGDGAFYLADKPPRELWIVDAGKLERHVADSRVSTERIHVGSYKTSMPRRPGDIRVVP